MFTHRFGGFIFGKGFVKNRRINNLHITRTVCLRSLSWFLLLFLPPRQIRNESCTRILALLANKLLHRDKFLPSRNSLPRHCAVLTREIQNNMTMSQSSRNLYHNTRNAQHTPAMTAKTHAILSLCRDSFAATMTMTCPALCRVTLPNHTAGPLGIT